MYTYFKNIYIGVSTVLVGMFITLKHMFTRSVTVQYPHEKLPMPPGSRNLLLNIVEDCIGCDQCVRACPVDCIDMEVIKVFDGDDLGTTSDGRKKSLWIPVFDIDMAKCCYCGLCVYPCPTDCLVMTDEIDYSKLNRDNLVFKFSDLTPEQSEELRQKDEIRQKEKEAKKLAAMKAKEAAAPQGSDGKEAKEEGE